VGDKTERPAWRKDGMRIMILYYIIKIGNTIAFQSTDTQYYDNGNARVTVTHAPWYRPLVAFGFWLCREVDD
jgi:hypothetical protein